MSRLIDLDVRAGMLWLSFPRDVQLQAVVKTLPGRTWDGERRQWGVPIDRLAGVVAALQPFHFQMTPRCRDYWLSAAAGSPSIEQVEKIERIEVSEEDGLTVSALNHAARAALVERFDDALWLVGELDNWDKNRRSGHAWFELVERPTVGGDAVASVRGVMFRQARRKIEAQLGHEVTLHDGALVRVKGRVDLYETRGSYQFVVEDIDADWVVGAQKRKVDKILAKLEELGIIGDNRAIEAPLCPCRVGVITALDSDAYNDFVHELERAPHAFDVTAVHATMQGPHTTPSILSALRWFYRRADEFDVVAIVRGGGSRSDLTHVDSFDLARAVCLMPVKVVCGVGHHRDQSVLDVVAHSEKTPTAAAQWIVSLRTATCDALDAAVSGLGRATSRTLDGNRHRLDRAASSTLRRIAGRLNRAEQRFQRASTSVVRGAELFLSKSEGRIDALQIALERAALRRVERASTVVQAAKRGVDRRRLDARLRRERGRVVHFTEQLERATRRTLRAEGLRLDHVEARLRLSDPRRVVERGYAIVRDGAGEIVTTAGGLRQLDRAIVDMKDGAVVVLPTGEDHDDRREG